MEKTTTKSKKTFKEWVRSRKTQRGIVIITFSLLPLLLLFVFTYLPFGAMIGYSFYDMGYIGTRTFIGLENYKAIFTRPDIISTLKLSLYYLAGAVIQIGLALYLATILSMKVKCGNLFKGCIFFPYLINGIAIGFIFKFFFTRGYVFDTILSWFGFNMDKLPWWLRDKSINNWTLTSTSVWRYLGQNMILFLGAIMSVDTSLYEAATIDGANRFQQFRYIILPSIKTIVTLNVILAVSGSLSAFDAPFVVTGGANGTSTYFITMHNLAHTGSNPKVGLASAMAVFLLVLILIVTLIQKLVFKYAFRNAEVDDESQAAKKKHKKMQRLAAVKGA